MAERTAILIKLGGLDCRHVSVEPEPELLSVAALPAVEFPTIQIVATLPGASPETMGASVVLFYNTLRHGMGYADPGASYYEDRYWPT